MLLHDTSGDVQAKTHAREASIVDVSCAVEALEHEWLIFDGYADAAILHAEARLRASLPHPDDYPTVVRTVLERVFDQIDQELLDARCIHRGEHGLRRYLNLDSFAVR